MKYRPDIDGLRAIAVLAVVFYHANLLPGGFIGVDVFFVISGYLITSIILDNDHLKLSDFYQRRIRRIFPALILVLSTCLLIGSFELFSDELEQLGKHVWASSVFISNFILWKESGYFDTAAHLKPLLHLWSLGVEEQFYIFWPLIVVFARKRFLSVTITLIVVSLLLNFWRIHKFPVETFFLPFSRIWELLAGGLLAYYRRSLHSNILSIMGAVMILLPMFFTTNNYLYALIPVLGTLILLASNLNSLGTRWPVYIGKISYPLYLWHWPLLSFLYIFNKTEFKYLAIVLSFILAALTYEFIEKRFRQTRPMILLCCLLGLGVIGLTIQINNGFKGRLSKYESEIAQVANKKSSEYSSTKCLDKFDLESGFCLGNYQNPKVLLIGDSQANQLVPMLKTDFLNLGQGACPVVFGIHTTEIEGNPISQDDQNNCIRITGIIRNLLKDPNIETVIFFDFYQHYFDQRFKTTGQYKTALIETLSEIKKSKRLIVVLPIPELDFEPKNCITSRPFFTENPDCKVPRVENKEVRELLKDFDVFDPLPYLCDEYCYVKKEGILYHDKTHLSVKGAEYLGQYFSK